MNTQPTPPPDKPQGAETPRTDAEAASPLAYMIADQLICQINYIQTMNVSVPELAKWLDKYLQAHANAQLTAATEALEKAKAELARAEGEADCQRRINFNDKRALFDERDSLKHQLADEREQSGKREAALREALILYAGYHGSCLPCHRDDADMGDAEICAAAEIDDKVNAALSQQAPTNDTQG